MKEHESQIQRAILDYLQLLENQGKCFCFRSGAGAVKLDNGRYFKTGRPGISDITIFVPDGKYICAEIKTPKGKQSDSQKKFEKQIKKLGGQYWLIRSVDEFITRFLPYI